MINAIRVDLIFLQKYKNNNNNHEHRRSLTGGARTQASVESATIGARLTMVTLGTLTLSADSSHVSSAAATGSFAATLDKNKYKDKDKQRVSLVQVSG